MKADLLITGISQLVTAEGAGAKHGRAMRELKIVEHAGDGHIRRHHRLDRPRV